MNKCILIMGVSGTGKSTVAAQLAQKLNLVFIEGDDYHPKSNIDKMASGIPLNDEDRAGWLESLSIALSKHEQEGCVLACSALKENYRKILMSRILSPLYIFLLEGDRNLILQRMKSRNHFMPPALLDSQLKDLEKTEDLISFSISDPASEIISRIENYLEIH